MRKPLGVGILILFPSSRTISYAGLSPVEYSSGSSIKGRTKICKQGGKQLRHILYMGALNAKENNAACKALFD